MECRILKEKIHGAMQLMILLKNIIKTFKKIKGFKIINTGSFKTIPIATIAKMVKKIGEKYLKKKLI